MASPAYRSRSTYGFDFAGGPPPYTQVILSKPTGTVEGDHMTALVMVDNPVVSVTSVPSGWVLLETETQHASYRIFYYGKKAGASEPTSYTWSFSAATRAGGVIITSQGAPAFNKIVKAAYQPAGTTLVQSVTTDVNDTLLIRIWVAVNSGSPPWSESTGTEQFEYGQDHRVGVSTEQQASPGTFSVTGTSFSSGILFGATVVLNTVLDATVVAPVAAATAARAAPAAAPGIGAVPARATAVYLPPPVVTGAQTVVVVPARATASSVAPRPSSSRMEILLIPDIGGEIELVEDT